MKKIWSHFIQMGLRYLLILGTLPALSGLVPYSSAMGVLSHAAPGITHSVPSGAKMAAPFAAPSILSVTINGSVFCAGQPVVVHYDVSVAGGLFNAGNIFTG